MIPDPNEWARACHAYMRERAGMSSQAKVIRVHNDLPLRMHATPFLEARVISKLPVGAIVDIEAVEGGWMCVYDRATGHTGWVDRKYVQELPPAQPDVFPAPCEIEPVGYDSMKVWTAVFGAFLLLIAAFAISVLIFPA